MKKIYIIILAAFFTFAAKGQSTNSTPTKYTTHLGVPTNNVPSLSGAGGLNYFISTNKLGVANGSLYEYIATETWASARFAQSATNTGDQTLTKGTAPGNIVLSAGGNVTINSMSSDGGTTFNNAATAPASRGFFPYITSTGTTGYPADNGNGFWLYRNASTLLGSFGLWKSSSATDKLYYVTGASASTLNTFHIFASEDYVAATYSTIPTGNTSSASVLTVDVTKEHQVFSGTTSTWTLPAITGNTWKRLFIKNRGSGVLTINANGGTNTIYLTAAVNTIALNPGDAIILINDGTYWDIN